MTDYKAPSGQGRGKMASDMAEQQVCKCGHLLDGQHCILRPGLPCHKCDCMGYVPADPPAAPPYSGQDRRGHELKWIRDGEPAEDWCDRRRPAPASKEEKNGSKEPVSAEKYPLPFYGPHPCDKCGRMVVVYSQEGGGKKFAANYESALSPGLTYPNTAPELEWHEHICVPVPGQGGQVTEQAVCKCGHHQSDHFRLPSLASVTGEFAQCHQCGCELFRDRMAKCICGKIYAEHGEWWSCNNFRPATAAEPAGRGEPAAAPPRRAGTRPDFCSHVQTTGLAAPASGAPGIYSMSTIVTINPPTQQPSPAAMDKARELLNHHFPDGWAACGCEVETTLLGPIALALDEFAAEQSGRRELGVFCETCVDTTLACGNVNDPCPLCALRQQLQHSEERVEALRDRLLQDGRHAKTCGAIPARENWLPEGLVLPAQWHVGDERWCNCGLAAALGKKP